MSIDDEKQAIRTKVWRLLKEHHATTTDPHGKIPSFKSADKTAQLLSKLDVWHRARTIKANPDNAQLPVRVRALEDGKLVYMAVPRMAGKEPFYRLDPATLAAPASIAADKDGAARSARRVSISGMEPIDIVICGSVAVNRSGARIGKGAGYSDLEVALLIEAGLVTERTVIVAPVHQVQVIDDRIPETEHDFRVDLIVTPEEVIKCAPPRRPPGIIQSHLTPEIIKAIPVLANHGERS